MDLDYIQGFSLRVHFFGVIRISDPRSLGSWCIKGTAESTPDRETAVPLMHHDPSDLGSLILIQIIPKERILGLKQPIILDGCCLKSFSNFE